MVITLLPGKERDDHHLDVRHIGECLDLQSAQRVKAEQGEGDRQNERRRAPPNSELDQAINHGWDRKLPPSASLGPH
jgi:hypothetical protein